MATNKKIKKKTPAGKRKRFDYDGLWKDLVEKFFYLLLKRIIPALYAMADTSKKPKFLNTEFRDKLSTSDPHLRRSPYFADFIVEVPLIGGDRGYVILHIEIQGRGGGDLAERMHLYECLVYGHYRIEPVSVAIITDKRPAGELPFYEYSFLGTTLTYRYNNFVLSELDDEELKSSDNAADFALYAAKCAVNSKGEIERYNYLRLFLGLLSKHGWSVEEKRELMIFIERFLYLEDMELRAQYRQYQEQLVKEGKAVYISIAEEAGIKKGKKEGLEKGRKEGLEKGMEKGKKEMARSLLASGVSPEIIAQSAGMPLAKVLKLAKKPR